jgi:hypothetical protein
MMSKFRVRYSQYSTGYFDIEADSIDNAKELAYDLYELPEVVERDYGFDVELVEEINE